MATVQRQPVLQPVPITSVQPGGGWCLQMELLWGRLRRAALRRFRPAYVQSMMQKRQGNCPNCPHDIIDSRDLKFHRNVCGYWFRPEDDPYRWREYLGVARHGLAEIIVTSLLLGPAALALLILTIALHPLLAVPLGVVLLGWGFLIAFFRDPVRAIPLAADVLVSPADGTVTHIDEVPEPDFRGGRALRISIFLSIFNVHVNRIPRSGKIVGLRYFPGAFLDARHPQCGIANEQLWIDLLDSAIGRQIRIKQISGKLARRIVCWLKVGEDVKRGDRFGMIKFGSRTEVYLPADLPLAVQVKVGDKVKGGSSVLLRLS